jgi:prepilin-type processing-associated H-X9-DG protein
MKRDGSDVLQPPSFTLIELLVVIACVAILVALLLAVLNSTNNEARRTICLNNLRQINLGIRMYCDDSNDSTPMTNHLPWIAYKELVKNYVGLKGPSSQRDKIFACPSDTFYYYGVGEGANGQDFFNLFQPQSQHNQSNFDYSSYTFNARPPSLTTNNSITHLGGLRFSSIINPVKTVLVAESPAFYPYSWHDPKRSPPGVVFAFNNAKNMVGFVDGHVSYTKIYWNSNAVAQYRGITFPLWTASYNPPDGYDYKWSGD